MILVTDPGTYNAVYPQLLHSPWNGATATDMIFPAFLFAVGVATTLSLQSRLRRGHSRLHVAGHAILRSMIIFIIGLLVNGFPDFNLHTIRIPGVLQRIALCYLASALLCLALNRPNRPLRQTHRIWVVATVAAVLLAGYWCALMQIPVPGFGPGKLDSFGNVGAYVDRAALGIQHLWPYGTTPGKGVTYDPEGILSTIPAVASTLIGVIAGEWLGLGNTLRQKASALAILGICLALLGVLLDPLMPINKRIWTSTFALLSSGVSLLLFAALIFVVDIKRWRRWAAPFVIFGTNALLAFTFSSVITTLSDRSHIVLATRACSH